MKIFKDHELNEEVSSLELGVGRAGSTIDYTFYLSNESDAELRDLQFLIEHKEVCVMSAPELILPRSTAKLEVRWTPSLTVKEGLNCKLSIRGHELWG